MLSLDLINDIKSFSKDIKVNKKVSWEYLSHNSTALHLLEEEH